MDGSSRLLPAEAGIERVHYTGSGPQVVKRTETLQARVDGLFRIKSPEQSLSDIAASSSESKDALQVLHEKVGSALQESVQHVGEHTSRAVSDAMEASLAPVMKEIAQLAANQSADVFKEVSAQLTSSFNQIGVSLAEELKASSYAMRSTLDYMGQQLSRHADEHLSRMTALEESTTTQLRDFSEAHERQLRLLDEALPPIVAGLNETATLVGTATQEMTRVTSSLGQVSQDIGSTTTTLARMLGDAIDTMDKLASQTTGAANNLADQQGTLTELTGHAVTAAQLLQHASTAMTGGFDGMRAAQAAFLADLEQQAEKHSQVMTGWLTDYSDKVGKQTDHRMGEWDRQTNAFSSTMLTATQALADAIDELGSIRTPEDAGVAA